MKRILLLRRWLPLTQFALLGVATCSGSIAVPPSTPLLGGAVTSGSCAPTLGPLGITHCSGSCIANLPASSPFLAKGKPIRRLRLVRMNSFLVFANIQPSLQGIAHCSGSITAAAAIAASAVGITRCLDSLTVSVRLLAALGIATCSGSIVAKNSAVALGITKCGGSISPAVAITPKLVGQAKCSGSAIASLFARALGVATCLGNITPPLIGSSQGCVSGNTGPATLIPPKNRVY